MQPTPRPIQFHYRPRQLVVLAALALAWLLAFVVAAASAFLFVGADLTARVITTQQHAVLHNPVSYSHPAEQRVWRVTR